jgi:hypothetical protein
MLVSQQVHHVCGIGWIEKGEARLQPERLCTTADELVRDGVKSPATKPSPALSVAAQGGRSSEHVVCRTPCESQQQDLLWCYTALEQSGHARRQRACLACAGACHDHKWVVAMDDRGQLRLVEIGVPSRIGVHMFDASAQRLSRE